MEFHSGKHTVSEYFRSQNLIEKPLTEPNSGFRPGQLGALHSLLAHFSVYEEPAILCLPTGYGKTALIMSVPFILKASRVLVVEPTNALRKQTASHFSELSTLRKISVADNVSGNPKVLAQEGIPKTKSDWEHLKEFDVVVSTPQSTSPLLSDTMPSDLFDVIIFDEAHHAPADTWVAYLKHFPTARFVFLTATPFRRDKKPIPGRSAYWYPVHKASREQAFGKVHFRAAQAKNDQDEYEVDLAVVREAIRQLQKDTEAGFDHRIFARAKSIPAARDLSKLYDQEGANVRAITSHITKRTQDQIERQLIEGEIDGVVCVDMFGEGYDFPKFKIAALHAPHRSLVPTLQFVGRFARTNDESTGDATLIAPTARIREAGSSLFKEGVDIADLIDEVSMVEIADAASDREILDVLKLKKQADSDYEAVTPLLLKLYAHTRIFECSKPPDFSQFGDTIGNRLFLVKQWNSDDGLISLLLTVDHSPPNWASSDTIANLRHDAFLLAYNEATQLCFVGCTRRTEKLYLDLIETVCPEGHRPVGFETTRRALNGLNDLRFYNVGLKNTAINTQSESYRMLTGPRAERAVSTSDARSYVQGHFFGSGADGEERETVGATGSSKIWSNKRLTVSEYLDWVSMMNARINADEAIAPSQLDLVQHAKTLEKIPAAVIGAAWNKVTYKYATKIRFREPGAHWTYGQISDFELSKFDSHPNGEKLAFSVVGDVEKFDFVFTLEGGTLFRQTADEIEIEAQSGIDDWMPFNQWMALYPPIFFSVDKSSFQGRDLMRVPSVQTDQLAHDDATSLDWTGANIRLEFGETEAGAPVSIHDFLRAQLAQKEQTKVLLYDHRTGEAADFIEISQHEGDRVIVALYHCKSAGGEPSGKRVNDVYEVACQMLKSVAYCDSEILLKHVAHRINPDRHKHPTQFIAGSLEEARKLLLGTAPNQLTYEIYGVQPGISLAQVDAHLADLMAFGLDYVRRGGAANSAWIVSP